MKVEIYTKPTCPYCIRAKTLLQSKNVDFIEYDVSDPADQDAMIERANSRRTVPQIFINDEHIGGCDDLYALERSGQLDQLLGKSVEK